MYLNLRQIEAFRAVMETGSMTEAGQVLGVSQPAVSRLIRDFEDQSGINLFMRHAGRIEPTKDAVALHREVARCMGELEQMAKFASDLGEFRRHRLRVAATVGHSYFMLPKVIAEFHKQFPEVTISLRSGLSAEVVDLIDRGQSDIGFALLSLDVQGVRIEQLPETELVCVLPRQHPLVEKDRIDVQDLAAEPLLLISENSLMRKRLLQAFESANITPNVIVDSTYTGPICSLVAGGMGISILDKLTAQAYANHNIAIRPFAPSVPCELKLVLPARQALSKPAQAFVDISKSVMQHQPDFDPSGQTSSEVSEVL